MKNNDSESRIVQKINDLMNNNEDSNKLNKIETIKEDITNINESDDLTISENLNINLLKSDETYNSMFSIISLNKENKEKKDNLEKSLNSKNTIHQRYSDISQMSTSCINNNTLSFWEMIKLKFNDIKNRFIFNYNIFSSPNNLVNIEQKLAKEIQIFDVKYTKQEELLNKLKNIPWFSYRENFDQIKENQNIYTSDAGWGCMLRASQMILAQGLCKLNNIEKLVDFINRFFAYFYDNKIPVKFMCKSNKKENEKEDEKEVDKKDIIIKKINPLDSFEIIDRDNDLFYKSFINLTSEMVEGLENMSERHSDKEYIVPPYSIRNLIKVEKHINKNGKQLGEWFSNYDCIRIIGAINQKMNIKKDCDFKVINCNEGIIRINSIIQNCFEEYKEDKQISDFELLSLSSIECFNIVNNNLENNKYIFNNKKYILKSKFLLFVSVRHGLYSLEEDYCDEVLKIFDIENNIGIIGGKKTRAFYFIGKCGNNLIFLDPHYVQETLSIKKIGTNVVQETYIPNDIFYMNVNEISPSFTIGFAINDMKSFKKLMKKFEENKYFIDTENGMKKNLNNVYIFEVKNF